jgi:hypothetical protein
MHYHLHGPLEGESYIFHDITSLIVFASTRLDERARSAAIVAEQYEGNYINIVTLNLRACNEPHGEVD